jgi:hypothetical protein
MPKTEATDHATDALIAAIAADAPLLHTRLLAIVGAANQQRTVQKLAQFTPATWLWDTLTNLALTPEVVAFHQQLLTQKDKDVETTVNAHLDQLKAAL